MSRNLNYFRQQPQKEDEYEKAHQANERLMKADFGVRQAWSRFPKWQENWLVNFYRDWFDAVESLNATLAGESPKLVHQVKLPQGRG